MSTRLVILGMLRERPLHGYEIKHIIQDHMGDWTSIAFGSIYFALNKLDEQGFVEKIATEQQGNRPSRSVYQITDTGRAEFLKLLRQVWSEVQQQYFVLDIGLFFMTALPLEEIKGHLQSRVDYLQGLVQYLNVHQAAEMSNQEVPPLANAIFEHSRVHFQAELAWTQDLMAKVEQGVYP